MSLVPASLVGRRSLADDVDLGRVGRYRSLREVYEAIEAIDGAELTIAARSHGELPIVRVELGPRDAKEATLIVGGLHAMEWIGVETGLSLLSTLAAQALDRRIVAFPVANPDGYLRAEDDLRATRRRFVRANARGVDLNRNWPTHWKRFHLWPTLLPFLGGPGTHPGSEPEVAAVLSAIEARRFDRGLSLHSFGNKLLLPFGGRWARPTNAAELDAIALDVKGRLWSRYDVTSSSRWVPGAFAHGMELDHWHAVGMVPLLVECSRGGFSWSDPSSWLQPFRWFNPSPPEPHVRELTSALVPFLLAS